jgi:hypothetical protein
LSEEYIKTELERRLSVAYDTLQKGDENQNTLRIEQYIESMQNQIKELEEQISSLYDCIPRGPSVEQVDRWFEDYLNKLEEEVQEEVGFPDEKIALLKNEDEDGEGIKGIYKIPSLASLQSSNYHHIPQAYKDNPKNMMHLNANSRGGYIKDKKGYKFAVLNSVYFIQFISPAR